MLMLSSVEIELGKLEVGCSLEYSLADCILNILVETKGKVLGTVQFRKKYLASFDL